MEEPCLLESVQGRVRGVKVQHQTPRRLRVRRHELIEQHPVDRHRRLPVRPLLQPAQRRRARQGCHPAGRRLQRRVVAQLSVVVQVLVSQGQGVDALPEQVQKTVVATGLAASVIQHPRHRSGQSQPPVHLGEQLDAAVAGDVAAAEISFHLTAFDG